MPVRLGAAVATFWSQTLLFHCHEPIHSPPVAMAGMTQVAVRRRSVAAPAADALEPAAVAKRALVVARATALGVLGDREAAADVAQEVAIVAVRKARTLREPAALDGWLHKIAVRTALAQARRGRRRLAAEHAHYDATVAAASTQDDAKLVHLLELLADLPARQRAALTLRYVHDLPDAAIGRALGCRTGTVRSLLSRGRAAIRASHQASTTRTQR